MGSRTQCSFRLPHHTKLRVVRKARSSHTPQLDSKACGRHTWGLGPAAADVPAGGCTLPHVPRHPGFPPEAGPMSPMRQQYMAVEQQVLPCPLAPQPVQHDWENGCKEGVVPPRSCGIVPSQHDPKPSAREPMKAARSRCPAYSACTLPAFEADFGCSLLRVYAWPSSCGHTL